MRYRGRATIRESDGILAIASAIGGRTYVCQGRLDGAKLNVYGDFEVEYSVEADGSLVGAWGNGGLETLTPIEKPIGTKLGYGHADDDPVGDDS